MTPQEYYQVRDWIDKGMLGDWGTAFTAGDARMAAALCAYAVEKSKEH